MLIACSRSNSFFRRLLLITYSISPGIAKVFEDKTWFVIGIAIFCVYLLVLGRHENPATIKKSKKFYGIDLILIFILSYALVLNLVLYVCDDIHLDAVLIGTANFLIPLLLTLRWIRRVVHIFIDDIYYVGLIHLIIACFLFIGFNFSDSTFKYISDKVLNGAIPYRMSSVSGSVAFSSLMTVCFALASYKYLASQRVTSIYFYWVSALLFFLSVLLSMQRASWVGIVFIGILIYITKNGKKLIATISTATILVSLLLFYTIDLPQDVKTIAAERFLTLFNVENNPISERSTQWANLALSLSDKPFGAGIGQLGQAARIIDLNDIENPIYDGDMFRIIAEYGVAGFALVLFISVGFYRALSSVWMCATKRVLTVNSLCSAAFIALVIQTFGSNLTEVYFVNSLFWALLLIQFQSQNKYWQSATYMGYKGG